MAAAIGQTSRNLADLLEHPQAGLFFSPLDPPDEAQSGRSGPSRYRVRMVDEPLTPDDQQRIAVELSRQWQEQPYGQDPETGQLNLFPIFDRLSGRQNFAYGQAEEKMTASESKNRRLEAGPAEKMTQHEPALAGKNAATLKDSLIPTFKDHKKLKEQKRSAAELQRLMVLFEDLSIQEPARSKLLANPQLTVAQVGAWVLYAETQPALRDSRSYIIKRLLANDPPPPEFLTFAGLDDAAWDLFEEAAHRLRTGQPLAVEIAPGLLETFIRWAEVYGGLTPLETRYLLAQQADQAAVSEAAEAEPESRQRELARSLWLTTLDQLRLQMTQQTFNNWLRQTELLDYRENIFVIDAKNLHAKAWLENRLVETIERTLTSVVGAPTQVRFVVERET